MKCITNPFVNCLLDRRMKKKWIPLECNEDSHFFALLRPRIFAARLGIQELSSPGGTAQRGVVRSEVGLQLADSVMLSRAPCRAEARVLEEAVAHLTIILPTGNKSNACATVNVRWGQHLGRICRITASPTTSQKSSKRRLAPSAFVPARSRKQAGESNLWIRPFLPAPHGAIRHAN